MKADFPSERWFWFDPPFHDGQTALLHRQPENIYRIDLELGRDADVEEEKKPEKVIPRIRAMIGEHDFEFDWISVYRLQCRLLERFAHGRIIFAGDLLTSVSIFGARGGNGGIQDADNLAWKLAAVLKGAAPQALLDTYEEERIPAAKENVSVTFQTARFMAPQSKMEKIFREAVLSLANSSPFARRLVNSGRLSTPHALCAYSLQTPADGKEGLQPGLPCPDAPLGQSWLLNTLGNEFCLLVCGFAPEQKIEDLKHVLIGVSDELALARYGKGLVYLIRPDQHIAAVFSAYDENRIRQAHKRALGEQL